MKKNMTTNALLNTIRTLVNILFPLITFKYASQVLLSENLGKVNFASSVLSYFTLLADFGILTYASREGAKYREDRKKFEEFASQIYTINIITTVVAYVALFVLMQVWDKLDVYRWILAIQSISLAFTVVGATWVNTIYEDYRSILIRSIGVQIVSVVLLFVLVRSTDDYLQYALVSAVATTGANCINAFYIRKYCRLNICISRGLQQHIKPLLIMAAISLTTTLYANSGLTLVGIYQNDEQVALYSVAIKIYTVIKAVLAAMIIVVIPRLTELYHQKKQEEYHRAASVTMDTVLLLTIPLIVGIVILSKEAVIVVSGNQYLDAVPSLIVLCVATLFAIIATYVTDVIVLPQGLEKGSLYASVFSAVVNVVLNLWFIPMWGIVGAAVTTLISELAVCIFLIVYVIQKNSDNYRILINKQNIVNILMYLFACIVFYSVNKILNLQFSNIFLQVLVTVVISSVIYFGLLILMRNKVVCNLTQEILKFIKKKGK